MQEVLQDLVDPDQLKVQAGFTTTVLGRAFGFAMCTRLQMLAYGCSMSRRIFIHELFDLERDPRPVRAIAYLGGGPDFPENPFGRSKDNTSQTACQLAFSKDDAVPVLFACNWHDPRGGVHMCDPVTGKYVGYLEQPRSDLFLSAGVATAGSTLVVLCFAVRNLLYVNVHIYRRDSRVGYDHTHVGTVDLGCLVGSWLYAINLCDDENRILLGANDGRVYNAELADRTVTSKKDKLSGNFRKVEAVDEWYDGRIVTSGQEYVTFTSALHDQDIPLMRPTPQMPHGYFIAKKMPSRPVLVVANVQDQKTTFTVYATPATMRFERMSSACVAWMGSIIRAALSHDKKLPGRLAKKTHFE